jgi:fibronectin type 3 domain-containing protein
VPPSVGETALRIDREGILRERDGEYGFNTARYGITLGSGRIDLSVERGLDRPQFSYAFEEIRVGAAVVARGGASAPKAREAGTTVCYDRGTVEEQYVLGPESVEQNFLIRELPAVRGEIAVTGRVTTSLEAPAEGTTGPQLLFSREGREVLSISKAVAVDGAGRRLPLDLAYAAGRVSITIPSSWVERAELPILVDPLIGGALHVDGSAVNPTGVADAVAYNPVSNEWFVVWNEQYGASNNNIYGQRISASGALVGSALSIGTNTANDTSVAVCASGSTGRYLVAWSQGTSTASKIMGRVLESTGTAVAAEFTLADLAGADNYPDIAWDGTKWFVVWDNASGIMGRFVATTGTPGTQVTVSAYKGQGVPRVAFSSGVYMIVWRYYGPMARTMNTSGTFLADAWILGNPNPWIDTGKANWGNAISAGPAGKFLVSWINNINEGRFMSLIANTAMGVEKSGIYTLESGVGAIDTFVPNVLSTAWSSVSNEWFVAYEGYVSSLDVCATRVTSAGVVAGYERVASTAAADTVPAVAWNSATNEMLVAYRSTPAGGTPRILAQRYGSGKPPAPTGLTAVAGHTRVLLNWTATVGATTYNVRRATVSGGPYTTVATGIYGTTYTNEGLTNGTAYYYVISAVNASGEGANSAQVSATPAASPVVTGLAAQALDGQVRLTWTAVSGATSYEVFRAEASGGPFLEPFATGTNSFVDDGLVNGKAYYYFVVAYVQAGPGPASSQVSATPTAVGRQALLVAGTVPLPSGSGDAVIQSRLTQMGYSVTAKAATTTVAGDASGKAIVVVSSTVASGDVNTKFRDVAVPVLVWENAVYDDMKMTSVTSGTDFGTLASQTSVVIVTPSHAMAAGKSGTVAVVNSGQTFPCTWGVPNSSTAIKIASVVGNSTRLSIFGYEKGSVMVGMNAPARRVGFFPGDATAAVFSANGWALFEAAVRWASGAPATPNGVSLSLGDGTVEVRWEPVTGATSYVILRATSAGGPYTALVTGLASTSFTTAATNGTTYYYQVQAQNSAGRSAATAAVQGAASASPLRVEIKGRGELWSLPAGDLDAGGYSQFSYEAVVRRIVKRPVGGVLKDQADPVTHTSKWEVVPEPFSDPACLQVLDPTANPCRLKANSNKVAFAVVRFTATVGAESVSKTFAVDVGNRKRVIVYFRFPNESKGIRRTQRVPAGMSNADLWANGEDAATVDRRRAARYKVVSPWFAAVENIWKSACVQPYFLIDTGNDMKFDDGYDPSDRFVTNVEVRNGSSIYYPKSRAFEILVPSKNQPGYVNVYLLRNLYSTRLGEEILGSAYSVELMDKSNTVLIADAADVATIDVIAHEMGHVFSLEHVKDAGPIRGTINNLQQVLVDPPNAAHLQMLMYETDANVNSLLSNHEAGYARMIIEAAAAKNWLSVTRD